MPSIQMKTGKRNISGAPIKLSQDLITKLSSLLQRGAYIETATDILCIHKDSFYRWMKMGAKQKRGLHRALYDAVHRSLGEFEMNHLIVIDTAAKGAKGDVVRGPDGSPILDRHGHAIISREATPADWKASSWALERRLPKKWGSKQTIENITPELEDPTEEDENNLDAELAELRKANDLIKK